MSSVLYGTCECEERWSSRGPACCYCQQLARGHYVSDLQSVQEHTRAPLPVLVRTSLPQFGIEGGSRREESTEFARESEARGGGQTRNNLEAGDTTGPVRESEAGFGTCASELHATGNSGDRRRGAVASRAAGEVRMDGSTAS